MKTIHTVHTVAGLVVLAYLALVIFNLPPLVRSDHVSVNWNMLCISVLGFLISSGYVIGTAILKKRMGLNGVHCSIIMVEAAGIATVSAICLLKSLRFFCVV